MNEETKLQKRCTDFMVREGWLPFRLRSMNGSGWPDYFYIRKGNKVVFIEYKTPTGTLSDIQKEKISEIQELGFDVYVIDRFNELKRIFG